VATPILGIAGNLILPGVGGVIGATLGAYIDANVIFAPDSPDIPKPQDIKTSAAAEGSPLPTAFGTTRVPCPMLWVSDSRAQTHGSGGGKGGQGGNIPYYTYRCDVAYACCVGPVEEIEEVYINAKRVFSSTGVIDVSGFAVQAAIFTYQLYHTGTFSGQTNWVRDSYLRIKSPNGGPDLMQFVVGNKVTISGWTAPYTKNNSAVHNVGFAEPAEIFSKSHDESTDETFITIKLTQVGAGTGSNGLTPPAFTDVFDNFPNGTGGQTIRIQQTNPLFNPARMDDAKPHNGSATQNPDATILTLEPDAPGFRGMAYIVLKNLDLSDFGNSPPVLVEARVRVKTNHTLQEVIESICAKAKLTGEVDASACASIICKGYSYLGAQSVRTILEPLLVAYDVVVQNVDGVLTFLPRADVEEVTVLEADLACHDFGSDAARDVEVDDSKLFDAPREVVVSFRDPDRRYQTGAQRQRRAVTQFDRAQKIDLAVVMESGEARAVANRVLWLSYMNSRVLTINLPPSYLGRVRENVRLTFTSEGNPYSMLVRQVDYGDNFILRCTGVMEDPRLLVQPTIAQLVPT